MLKKSGLYYSTLAVIASAIYSAWMVGWAHPSSYVWVLIPVMAVTAFVGDMVGQKRKSSASRRPV